MKNLLSEGLGTSARRRPGGVGSSPRFLLVLTVGCNVLGGSGTWAALSIASVLMVSIYALGHAQTKAKQKQQIWWRSAAKKKQLKVFRTQIV